MSATAKGGLTPVARSSQDGHLGLPCIFTSPIFGLHLASIFQLNKPFEKSSSLLATKSVALVAHYLVNVDFFTSSPPGRAGALHSAAAQLFLSVLTVVETRTPTNLSYC